MSSEYEIRRLLREAAEKLAGRKLTEQEASRLYQSYQQASGTPYNKIIIALSIVTSFSEGQIIEKRSSSDDFDRVMQDLKRELEGK
ncbi:MAG: hypothetical protein ABSB11_10390 [Sedimentisphaerales bacterium]|jgi:hypothetical protein